MCRLPLVSVSALMLRGSAADVWHQGIGQGHDGSCTALLFLSRTTSTPTASASTSTLLHHATFWDTLAVKTTRHKK